MRALPRDHAPAQASDDPQGVGRRIAAASDARRRHVERVLHDGVQQHLALLGLQLSMLQRQIHTDPGAAVEMCASLRDEIQSALAELRNVALLVYPALLDNEGLSAALRRAAARGPVPVSVAVEEETVMPPELVAPLYFCVIETIELLAPYAREPMSVRVVTRTEDVVLEVVAPAVDVSAEVLVHGMGYLSDRLTALGGTAVLSPVARGVSITGAVPMPSGASRS